MWGVVVWRECPLVWDNGVFVGLRYHTERSTRMVKSTVPRPRVKFTGGGRGLAVHARARLLADLADRVGLTAELSLAMAGSRCAIAVMGGAGCWPMRR